jgi:hypothetical protein
MADSYATRLAELEAEYGRLYDQIERQHGGVDYKGKLAALRKEIEKAKGFKAKFDKVRQAVESKDPVPAIVEEILDTEEPDSPEEIAADFIENEVGRFDWTNNWAAIKAQEDPVAKVRAYLLIYDLRGDPVEIVNIIDRMAQNNPGKWH